jgi:hypothetical protein
MNFEQAVRLAPQRLEARDELAALRPTSTEAATPASTPAPPVVPQPTSVPLPTRGPAPTLAPLPPAIDTPRDPTPPACDVRNADIACPLADGSRVQDSLAQPDGRHFYWFGVPRPGMRLHVEAAGQACPCA